MPLIVLTFGFYFLMSSVITLFWGEYIEDYHKYKKIDNVWETILSILGIMLFMLTFILDVLFIYISYKAIQSNTYVMYLYYLVIVMVLSQCAFAVLLPISIKTVEFVRRRQKES